jgi:outer membrane protein assembly factor BamA
LDRPGYPSSGGRYRASIAMFHDRDLARYSFRRFEADAAQYVPLGRSVLAFRGRIDVSQTAPGQDVPFYLLPSLGGANSLRGYLDYRFRDRDMLLMNAEYRWPLLRRVDAAVFYDAGSVASASNLLSRKIYTDYGAGLRLHSATRMLVRLDVARGAEGARALVSFSTPLALPNRAVAPYVP